MKSRGSGIITARIRRMTEGNSFILFVNSQTGEVSQPGPDRGYPGQFQMGEYPSQVRMGGVVWPGPDGEDRWGDPKMGYPPHPGMG